MKKIYLTLALAIASFAMNAQEYTYSLQHVGMNNGNIQMALVLTSDFATTNSPTADFGVTLRLPNDYTIGNFASGNAGFLFYEFNLDGTPTDRDQGDGTDLLQIVRTDIVDVRFTHPANQVYQTVLFDIIAQNGASQVPTTGEIKIEDIDGTLNGGVYDTWFNINLSEDAPGTSDYLKSSNPSVFTFASLSTIDSQLNGISIFPNPTKNILNIKGLETTLESVEVYSITGQKVISTTTNLNTINVSAIANGVYFLKLNTADASKTIKFVKE